MKKKIDNSQIFEFIIEELNTKDVSLTVKGHSMWPFLKSNKTKITLTKSHSYKKLDIVLFKYNNKYILHRIIKIKNNNYIIQGDGLISKEVVSKESIYAKVSSYTLKNKTTYTTNKLYLFKVRLWRLLRPIRRVLLKFRRMHNE